MSNETSGDFIQSRAKKVIKEAMETAHHSEAGRDIIHLAIKSLFALKNEDEPQTFKDALDHPNENERVKWLEVIKRNFMI